MQRVFPDIGSAVRYCEQEYAGVDFVFRGQTQSWDPKSSLFRIADEHEREKKWKETVQFAEWVLNNPALLPFHNDEDSIVAIAQHYGFATDFIDFSTDPRVAGFFATTGQPDPTKLGAIYVVSISSFEVICNVRKIQAFCRPSLPQVSGLWRLENQKGLFVRDSSGFVSQRPDEAIEDAVLFVQRSGLTVENFFPEITEHFVYPSPNDLEREIERYESIRLRRRPMDLHAFHVVNVERDPVGQDVEAELPPAQWPADPSSGIIDQTSFRNFPKIDPKLGSKELHVESAKALMTGAPVALLGLVRSLRDLVSLGAEALPTTSISFAGPLVSNFKKGVLKEIEGALESRSAELFQITQRSRLSNEQISVCLQNVAALELSRPPNAFWMEENMTRQAYAEATVGLTIEDESHVISQFYAPVSFFDRMGTMTFNLRYPQHSIRRNVQVLQFVHNIRKLMSIDEALQFWAAIVLPWQLVFRKRIARIYTPRHVTKIGYA